MGRRGFALMMVGLGAFCAVAGMSARYYAFPTLAVLPIDRFEETESRAQHATYVDRGTGKQYTDRELISINRIRGDVKSSTDDVAVWESFTWTRDGASGADVNFYHTVVAMDRHTAEARNCCGHHIESVYDLPRTGLVYQWPFFTEKTSYPFYDEVLRKTFPMTYQRTEELHGLRVYRFSQTISPTMLSAVEVPGDLVGRPGVPTVEAERWYGIERTYWIEPRSGVVVKAGNHRRETLRVDGADALVVFDADVVLGDRDSKRIVREAADARVKIGLLYNVAFWGGLLLGLVLIALAGLLLVRREAEEPAAQPVAGELAPVP
jgi:hypothetical protein